MPAIFFADLDALRLALASGAVPPAIGRAPARAGFDAQGHLWLQPSAPLARDTAAALTRLGAAVRGTSGAVLTEEVACWPQLLPLRPVPFDARSRPAGSVLFELTDATRLPALVAELRRLGSSRVGIRWIDGPGARGDAPEDDATSSLSTAPEVDPGPNTQHSALLMVESPPFFTLLQALDRGSGSPRAFVRQAPRVWVEVGYRHPLADQIEPPAGQVALLSAPRGWEYLTDGPLGTGPDQFSLPRRPVASGDRLDDIRLPLTLRLVPCSSDEPTELWVMAGDPIERLRALAEQSDDRLLARLLFAIGEVNGERVAVLRARPGGIPAQRVAGPPVLVLDGLGCRPYLRLPNLFLPVGQRLRPPLRRDAVRELLAADPDTLTWLEPTDHGRFVRHALPVAAFHPLEELVAYQVDREPKPALAWTSETPFTLEPFTVQELRPAPRRPTSSPAASPVGASPPKPPRPAARDSAGWWQRLVRRFFSGHADDAEGRSLLPAGRVGPAATTTNPGSGTATSRQADDSADEHRKAMEARFLAAANSPDAADRRALWPELATLYEAQNRSADAAVCWLNALWEDDQPQLVWARGWLRAEAPATRGEATDADLARWLAGAATPGAVRAAAAFAVWAAAHESPPVTLTARLDRVQRLVEDHEQWLPVRAAWLARLALARLTRGDVVGLARARDRLLERLYDRGLSVDLDVPTFLRFAGQASGERLETVRDWLLRAGDWIHRWIAARPNRPDVPGLAGAELLTKHDPGLRRFGLSTDLRATRAYADLILAWGLARLGERSVCQELLAQARTVLAGPDEAHAILLEAFTFRARQALDGRVEAGPLPPDLLARLDALERRPGAAGQRDDLLPYKVERLLQYSRILEPAERVDPYHDGVLIHFADDLQQSLAAVRSVRDRDGRARRLHQLLAAAGRDPDRLPRVLEVALDLAPSVGESFAAGVLDRLLATVGGFSFAGRPEQVDTQVSVLERGLFVAAHFDHTEVVQRLVGCLGRLFDPRRGGDVPTNQGHAEDALLALIGQSLRGLRRLGLLAEADLLLDRLGEWVAPGGDLTAARRRRPQDWPRTLRRLLALAGGWFYVGRDDPATATLDEARRLLFAQELRPGEQTGLACAYAAALGQAPVRLALGRVEELFQRLQGVGDTQLTNTHYSLARLRLVEAAVRAVVNDDFALGPAVRRWLDDDEFRVRHRIHRDTRALVSS